MHTGARWPEPAAALAALCLPAGGRQPIRSPVASGATGVRADQRHHRQPDRHLRPRRPGRPASRWAGSTPVAWAWPSAAPSVDDLASQGGLAYDASDQLLVGVNGGSNTISVFRTFGSAIVVAGTSSRSGGSRSGERRRPRRSHLRPRTPAAPVRSRASTPTPSAPIPGSARSLGLDARSHPAVPQHARPDRIQPRRTPGDRDHQGQRERHRRVGGVGLRCVCRAPG